MNINNNNQYSSIDDTTGSKKPGQLAGKRSRSDFNDESQTQFELQTRPEKVRKIAPTENAIQIAQQINTNFLENLPDFLANTPAEVLEIILNTFVELPKGWKEQFSKIQILAFAIIKQTGEEEKSARLKNCYYGVFIEKFKSLNLSMNSLGITEPKHVDGFIKLFQGHITRLTIECDAFPRVSIKNIFSKCVEIQELELRSFIGQDDDILCGDEGIGKLTNLHTLHLYHGGHLKKKDFEGENSISSLTNLKNLKFAGVWCYDPSFFSSEKGIISLSKLESLSIDKMPFLSDDAFTNENGILKLKSLKEIFVCKAPLTAKTVDAIKGIQQQINVADVYYTDGLFSSKYRYNSTPE